MTDIDYIKHRFSANKAYQIGAGVCTAMLIRNEFKVISQRDYASLEILFSKVDRTNRIDPLKKDRYETNWYKKYFKVH